MVRLPGFEPESEAWEASVLTAGLQSQRALHLRPCILLLSWIFYEGSSHRRHFGGAVIRFEGHAKAGLGASHGVETSIGCLIHIGYCIQFQICLNMMFFYAGTCIHESRDALTNSIPPLCVPGFHTIFLLLFRGRFLRVAASFGRRLSLNTVYRVSPLRTRGLVVMTSPLQGEGRWFDPGRVHHFSPFICKPGIISDNR